MAAKEKPGSCVLTEGCIKYDGHHLEKHAGARPCTTHAQAFPEEGSDNAESPSLARKVRKKPEREPLPTEAADWEPRHTRRVMEAIERAWGHVPPSKRPLLRMMVGEVVGQRDVEEVKS